MALYKKLPTNGHYLTSEDNPDYSDLFSHHTACNKKTKIRTISFILTEQCNLNCSYCYEVNKRNRKMSREVVLEAIDMLFDPERIDHYMPLEETEGYIIEFFGGEPFLEPELMDFIAKTFIVKAFEYRPSLSYYSHFSVSSNGTLYFQPQVQQVIKELGNKLSIGITIDGNKMLHDSCRKYPSGKGSYDEVEKAVKHYYTQTQSPASTKLTLAPENISYLYEACVNLWENVGIQFIHANCVFEDVWNTSHATILFEQLIKIADYLLAEDHYQKYYLSLFEKHNGLPLEPSQLEENFCGGNGQMLAIAPDGKLYPCVRFAPYALHKHKPFCIGSVYEGIDKRNKDIEALKKVSLRSQSSQKCLDCNLSGGCGLCTACNYDIFGTPNKRATYICENHHATVKANQYYFERLEKRIASKGE